VCVLTKIESHSPYERADDYVFRVFEASVTEIDISKTSYIVFASDLNLEMSLPLFRFLRIYLGFYK
jgi:hypothetical protein